MKAKIITRNMKCLMLFWSFLFYQGITAQNLSLPPQEDYLSFIKGTFEYVLFAPDTELDSLDELDHALFKQREIIEKETMNLNRDGSSYSEIETLWYDGYPMWREPFWKLRTEDNYTLMYESSATSVPDTSFHSELSLEINGFLDSLDIEHNSTFADYYKFTPFPEKAPKSDYVTPLDEGVYQIEIDDVITIYDNNEKRIESYFPDHTIKEYYTREIDGENFLAYRVESTPFQLRNNEIANRMIYTRFSNYQFTERESAFRSNDFEVQSMVRVYPNPSAEELTIEFPEKFQEGISKLEIFDMAGKRMYYQMVSGAKEVTLLLGNFLTVEGIYFLHLTNANQDRITDNFYFSKS